VTVKRVAAVVVVSLGVTAAPARAVKLVRGHASQGVGCEVENLPYRSTGTLVKAILTRDVGRGRYDGTFTVKVRRASRGAPRGRQSFVLNDTPVTFGRGVRKGLPDPRDRVLITGSISALPPGCPHAGYQPFVGIAHARFTAPKPPHRGKKHHKHS
jgi:hypothetical protein